MMPVPALALTVKLWLQRQQQQPPQPARPPQQRPNQRTAPQWMGQAWARPACLSPTAPTGSPMMAASTVPPLASTPPLCPAQCPHQRQRRMQLKMTSSLKYPMKFSAVNSPASLEQSASAQHLGEQFGHAMVWRRWCSGQCSGAPPRWTPLAMSWSGGSVPPAAKQTLPAATYQWRQGGAPHQGKLLVFLLSYPLSNLIPRVGGKGFTRTRQGQTVGQLTSIIKAIAARTRGPSK